MLCRVWGYEVAAGYDGSASALVPVFKPDVVVLDVAMPKKNGNDIVRQLRQDPAFKHLLIIAVSGFHDETSRLTSREAGFDHYLIKPVDPTVLEKLLIVQDLATRTSRGE